MSDADAFASAYGRLSSARMTPMRLAPAPEAPRRDKAEARPSSLLARLALMEPKRPLPRPNWRDE